MKGYIVMLICLFSMQLYGQSLTKKVIIVNSGEFGNPLDNVNIQLYDPADQTYSQLDTIQTSSAQDILVEGTELYVAAQDSIVKYDLPNGQRLAAQAFGAPSTVSMVLTDSLLFVGNWYLPWMHVGPYENNLRIFDRHDLSFVDSIPAVKRPAQDIVILNDTAYIRQNFTSVSFSDSAGWLVKVPLNNLMQVDSVPVNQNQEDLGRLFDFNGKIYGLNDVSKSITVYDPQTGQASTSPANANFIAPSYGLPIDIQPNGILYLVVDGALAAYDLLTQTVIDPQVVESFITDYCYDTVNHHFYVTKTNFFSFHGGAIYDSAGQRLDTLLTGTAPEGISLAYNALPVAQSDWDTTMKDMALSSAVLNNDTDDDQESNLSIMIKTPPLNGMANVQNDSVVYFPNTAYVGKDSLEYWLIDAWGDRDSAWLFIEVESNTSLELHQPRLVELYPNPASTHLDLRFEQPWTGQMELVQANGQIMFRERLDQTSHYRIKLDQWPAGIYWLRLYNELETWSDSWIKIR